MKRLSKFPEHFKAVLQKALSDRRENERHLPFSISLSYPGDIEMFESAIKKDSEKILHEHNCISVKQVHVFHRDIADDSKGFSKIKIHAIPMEDVKHLYRSMNEEISELSLSAPQVVKKLTNALNKAIMIADEFNNEYGEGKKNRTVEITECDKVLQKLMGRKSKC